MKKFTFFISPGSMQRILKFVFCLLSFSFLEFGVWVLELGTCFAQETYTNTINKILYDSRDSSYYPIEKIGNQWWMVVEITEPAQLIVSLGNDIAICTGGTAVITATVTGGTSPYTYSWNTGCTDMPWHVSIAGTYIVTVTDANGCTSSDDIALTLLPLPQLTVTTTNATCGNDDGGASVSVSGGASPYTYHWSRGDLTETAGNHAAGIYIVTVMDANGCMDFAPAAVNNVDGPVITVNSVTDISCYGGNDGVVDINVSGGAMPYTFEWSNGATTEDISGLSSAPYEIIVTGADGCITVLSISVSQPQPLTFSVNITKATCGFSDGSATISPCGGTSPYTFEWSNGATGSIVTGLGLGVYIVTVSDANGCLDSLAVPMSENGGPDLTIDSIFNVSCGLDNGAIFTSASGGVPPFTYTWSNVATSDDIISLGVGFYNVTVIGANDCGATAYSLPIAEPPMTDPIGFVTVDSITGKNFVIWQQVYPQEVIAYNLYRESSQQDVYYLLAQVPFDSLIIFSDTLSKPEQHSWKYKISVVDICGRESYLSHGHRTMHLKVKNFDGYIRLTWNKYEGFVYEQFYIYRAVGPQPYVLLDSVPATENMYIDSLPPQGELHYVLEVLDTAVVNLVLKESSHNSSRSNDYCDGIYVTISEIPDAGMQVEVYPNPNTGEFTIAFILKEKQDVIIEISDMSGKIIYKKRLNGIKGKNTVVFTVSSDGVYNIMLKTGEIISNSKVVVKGSK